MPDSGPADELTRSCQELGLASRRLPPSEALVYIQTVVRRYRPFQISGHLGIGHSSVSVQLETCEFSYSHYLPGTPSFVFFEQSGADTGAVVMVEDARRLGDVFSRSFGMEYFVSDELATFLLAVNWYVIEGAGSATNWPIFAG